MGIGNIYSSSYVSTVNSVAKKEWERESEGVGTVRLFDFTNAFAILFHAGDVTMNCWIQRYISMHIRETKLAHDIILYKQQCCCKMLLFLNLNNTNCKYNLMNAFASAKKSWKQKLSSLRLHSTNDVLLLNLYFIKSQIT